jgi:hypothetical protein
MKPETRIWLEEMMRRFGVPAFDEDRSNSNQHEGRSRKSTVPATLEDIGVEASLPLRRRRRYPGGNVWRGGA